MVSTYFRSHLISRRKQMNETVFLLFEFYSSVGWTELNRSTCPWFSSRSCICCCIMLISADVAETCEEVERSVEHPHQSEVHDNSCFLLLAREKTRRYVRRVTLKRRARCRAAGWAAGKCQAHMLRRSLAGGHAGAAAPALASCVRQRGRIVKGHRSLL